MSEQVVGGDFLSKLQEFWNKNQKIVLGSVGALIIAFGGFWAYKEYIVKPANNKANEAIFAAENYFAQDSSRKVLDGDGQSKGVLYVIKNHSGTPAANLAHYYAGVSYLKLGEFNKAIEHLKDFSTNSKPVQMVAYGALADAYGEAGKKEDAIAYYKKAGNHFSQDQNLSAEYLWRAAKLYETLNKNKEAAELYKEIKEKYPNAKSADIDRDIYKNSIEKNEFSIK